MYDPELARFMQKDTYRGCASDPLSLNLYTYCGNNPVMYTDPSGHTSVQVTMPNGQKVTASVTNGITTMPNGCRPPTGAIVHTAGGDYRMTAAGTGEKVNAVTVATSNGAQTGYIGSSGTTQMIDGSRPSTGSIVYTNGGTYQMTSSGSGTPVSIVQVLTPQGSKTAGIGSNGQTIMLDGSRPNNGSIVQTNGGNYQMRSGSGVEVAIVPVLGIGVPPLGGLSIGNKGTTMMLDGKAPGVGSIVFTQDSGPWIATPSGGVRVESSPSPVTTPTPTPKASNEVSPTVSEPGGVEVVATPSNAGYTTYNGLIKPISGTDATYDKDIGMDIAAPKGTPVYAAASGTIIYGYYNENDRWSPNGGFPNDTPYRVKFYLTPQ